VSKANGTWGQAIEIPGLATLNAGKNANAWSVSCATADNCAAGGTYHDSTGRQQAFVVSKANGTWGQAIEIPGLPALNVRGDAAVRSVSCGAAGNCAVGGTYTDGGRRPQAFVVNQT